MTLTSASSGVGSGTIVVQFAPNTTNFTRFGAINIAGWRVFVSQRSTMPPTPPTGMRIVVGG
jgi:hypothetical protein